MVVDESARFVTQRQESNMCKISAIVPNDGVLVLNAPGVETSDLLSPFLCIGRLVNTRLVITISSSAINKRQRLTRDDVLLGGHRW